MDFSRLIDLIGLAGAVLTTLCWLPQVMKAVRDKETRALSIGYRGVYRRGRALADLRAGDQRLAADRLQRGGAGADGRDFGCEAALRLSGGTGGLHATDDRSILA
jgi:hypothetical protein